MSLERLLTGGVRKVAPPAPNFVATTAAIATKAPLPERVQGGVRPIRSLSEVEPLVDVWRGVRARRGENLLNSAVQAKMVLLLHTDRRCTLVLSDASQTPDAPVADGILEQARNEGYHLIARCRAPATVIAEAYTQAAHRQLERTDATTANVSRLAQGANVDWTRFRHDILAPAVEADASDIHLIVRDSGGESRGDVAIRVHGDLERLCAYTPGELDRIISALYQSECIDSTSRKRGESFFQRNQDQQALARVPEVRNAELRIQTNRERYGFSVIVRILRYDGKRISHASLPDLGYEPQQVDEIQLMLQRATGVILIVGSTGSGKTTTMGAMVRAIPDRDKQRIITIEDPPETRFEGLSVDQVPVQRERDQAGAEAENPFIAPMRMTLRSDPDWIIPGEIRDRATVGLLEQAVLSGHRVLSTMHVSSAVGVIPRLRSKEMGLSDVTMGSEDFFSGVISQSLAPILCPHCRTPALRATVDGRPVLRSAAIEAMRTRFRLDPERFFARGPGCEHCHNRGVVGRTVVAELLTFTSSMRRRLATGDVFGVSDEWRAMARGKRFDEAWTLGRTKFEHALYKACQGTIGVDWLQGLDSFERYDIFGAPR